MPWCHRACFLLLSTVCVAVFGHPAQARPAANRDPDAARLVSEDLPRFWRAHDAAAADPAGRAARLQRDYLDAGSAGLREFTRLRIGDGVQLAAMIEAHPAYYAALRGQPARLARFEAPIRASWRRLAILYPDAVFPDVYFLVGRMNSGGTITDTGLLIGLEMYGLSPQAPRGELGAWHRAVLRDMDGLPHIVAHELVHYQQRRDLPGPPSLLQASLVEGIADFVAELASGAHINPHVHAWAEPRAAALFREFLARRRGTDTRGWLYDPEPGQGRPADLGYWVGYRIARAHYERAGDKAAAVREMLTLADFEGYLARSGLVETLGAPVEGRPDPATSH